MCGRYALTLDTNSLKQQFGFETRLNPELRFNIGPAQKVLSVAAINGSLLGGWMRWGWGGDLAGQAGGLIINARAETIAEKPIFKNHLPKRRCVVLATAFYDWREADKGKSEATPFLVRRPDRAPFAMAALWRPLAPQTSAGLEGVKAELVIITVPANDKLAEIHPRMPAMLAAHDVHEYLTADMGAAQNLLRPWPVALTEFFPVTPRANKASYDGPDCLLPYRHIDAPPAQKRLF